MDRDAAYADILLDRALREEPLRDSRDRALLTELVMGTLRRRGGLDRALAAHLARPLAESDPVSRNALRLGAYQLLHTRIPDRAALFETVKAAKEARGEKMAGFVNAVLRAVARARGTPGAAEAGPPDAAEARISVPPPLYDALVRTLGERKTLLFLSASLEKPPFAIRANPFKTTRDALHARLARGRFVPFTCRFAPDGLVLGNPGRVHADPGFRSGEYLVMDEGAQLVAPLLSPQPGEKILDACAAPGGKTTHLAALSGGKVRLVATDVTAGRMRHLKETIARTEAPGVETAVHDFTAGPLRDGGALFDKVLVDAPCTGMGVIRRNPDAKWRFLSGDPARMAALQCAILANAWKSLAPGGLLVYATCSPLREENEEVAARFLSRARGEAEIAPPPADWPGPPEALTPDGFIRLCPYRDGTDGFFAALFRRKD